MKLTDVIGAIRPLQVLGNQVGEVTELLTDSRETLRDPAHTLFFGLRTAKNDGAKYCDELYRKGVCMFVVEQGSLALVSSAVRDESTILVVRSALDALQDLAAYRRSLYHGPVIGITGSNGKTVVKEWLYQLLKDDYDIVRSPKSYNSQIGVALSVWQTPVESPESPESPETRENPEAPLNPPSRGKKGTLCIFEAGISEPGEMARLERMIRPTLGVITYIGAEHGENFASLEQKRAEKMLLFAHCDTVIEDPSHQNVRTCAAVMRALGYNEECIAERILSQTHETVMNINLSALVDNVRYFRSRLKPETKLTCMVKAFAYGAGSVEVSRALQACGMVDYLAVAVADEGVELRRAGITLPIIVMDPEVAAMDLILENNLEPNVYSFASLDTVLRAAEEKGLEGYPVHVKIDSGMHRLGFYREQIDELTARLTAQKALRVASVFSHLAGSDEAQFDSFTLDQIHYYKDCADRLVESLSHSDSGRGRGGHEVTGERPVLKHILNSAGIERFTDYQFDMCRLGIGLYGFSFDGAQLRTVCSLKTTLLSVKTVPAGDTIGYGRHTTLSEDRVIGVIPIGYADGFDRRFSNYGAEVLVRGKRCPIVGNVCMDQAMVDITGTDAQPGDEVEIFGERMPLERLSDKLGTITYEILTSISRRVKRVYYYE